MKTLLVTPIPDSLLDLDANDQKACLEIAIAATYCDNPKDIVTFLEMRKKYYSLGQVFNYLGYLRNGKKLNQPKIEKAEERKVENAIYFVNKYSDFPRAKVLFHVNRIAGWFMDNNMKPYRDNVDKLLQRALFLTQDNKHTTGNNNCPACNNSRYIMKFSEGEESLEPCLTCSIDSEASIML